MPDKDDKQQMPDDLKRCVKFHGHICPGLIYGYRVAKEAMKLLDIGRAVDEEVVAVCENDSCAVDAIQVLLGTVIGKGNLIIRDYGKNAYTVLSRSRRRAYRFSRKTDYAYSGEAQSEFERLDKAMAAGEASDDDIRKLKRLKVDDLLSRPFAEIFVTEEVPFDEPQYARLDRSESCALCGEMTMAVKMLQLNDGRRVCIPCSQKI